MHPRSSLDKCANSIPVFGPKRRKNHIKEYSPRGLNPSVRQSQPFFSILSIFVDKMWKDNETMLDHQTVDILKGIIIIITYISRTREFLKRMGEPGMGPRVKRKREGYGRREF